MKDYQMIFLKIYILSSNFRISYWCNLVFTSRPSKCQEKSKTHKHALFNILFHMNSTSINSMRERKRDRVPNFFSFSSRAFANGRFLMVTSNIMIFNPILVNIIQNSQTISVSFRLRPGKSGMRPWVTSSGNSFWSSILPYKCSSAKNDFYKKYLHRLAKWNNFLSFIPHK